MISAVNQFLETFDGLGNAIMPTEPRWGFAATPSLQQLQQQHSRQHDMSPDSHSDVPTSYVHQLERDHAFISNHCVAAMAQQLTVSEYTDNLSGTVLAPQLPDAAATDAALQSIREQVDGAWSKEAVWRGVGYAKSGMIGCCAAEAYAYCITSGFFTQTAKGMHVARSTCFASTMLLRACLLLVA